MVQTHHIAYEITKNPKYRSYAFKVFEWFLGKNYLNRMFYDEASDGCRDVASTRWLNVNEGTESTVM